MEAGTKGGCVFTEAFHSEFVALPDNDDRLADDDNGKKYYDDCQN
jgi:hypothetical protein